MSTNTTTGFVCQESFHLGTNTTACLRFDKLKRCLKDGTDNNLTAFLCVDQDTISIGGGGPQTPLPLNLTSSVFMCNLANCPTAAPVKNTTGNGGGGKNNNGGETGKPNGSTALYSERTLSLSGFFVIALLASQIMMLH
ncbi:hypothetical protein BGZ97_013078 [Linnemannia gamsii]|uniref:Uncharacterized protein n=1 Tax=Linnemannia gamsii TaxID=64522 RepID=A0A9P6UL02_9FUNG|nr:hypothetical protein BGZ97_013078 [Linnemannia gamsii]